MGRFSKLELVIGWLAAVSGFLIISRTFFAPLLCTSDGSHCISEFASMDRAAFVMVFTLQVLLMLAIGLGATFDSRRNRLDMYLTVWIASILTLLIGVLSAPSGGYWLALPALLGILAAAFGLVHRTPEAG